jgi:hypothetical protein
VRKAALVVLGLLLTSAAVVHGEDGYPIYVYPSPKAETAPNIDGLAEDPVWRDAPLVGGFTLYDKPEKVAVQTFLRVAWDDRALYLAVQCDEPLMDKLSPKAAPRDAKQIFADEAIEIFVDPDHDHSRYYQFGINAAGSLFDGERNNPAWNGDVSLRAYLGEDAWFVEVAIPWKDITKRRPAPGAVVGFNVCRDRHLSGRREWTNWAQTKANFHDPERFAHLVLSPTPEQLGKLGSEFRKGARQGPITLFSSEGFAQTSYAELAAQAFAGLDVLLAQLEKTQTRERDRKAARLLGELIEARRQEVDELRTTVSDPERIDAAVWTRTDLAIQQLSRTLNEAIWEARLSALLSGI